MLKFFVRLIVVATLAALFAGLLSVAWLRLLKHRPPPPTGQAVFIVPALPTPEKEAIIDLWRGVPVRFNGRPYTESRGKHHAADGYYYGKKWQCVEFMKRFYHDRQGHSFPDGMGHAADFFDKNTAHGALNKRRGLLQFRNGGDEPPAADDILVWSGKDGYGHVAIVTRADFDAVYWIQQNVAAATRGAALLEERDGKYLVGGYGSLGAPAGWLRLPPKR